jgi:hypothetical protein
MANQEIVTHPRGRVFASKSQIAVQVLVLALLILLLISYKGTSGLDKIRKARMTGSLHLAASQREEGSTAKSSLANAVTYLGIVWPALVYGILISAAVRTSLARTPLRTVLGRGAIRDQISGTLAGAPLMLCSCCVAPIFPAVYQRTRHAAPALALTLASPSQPRGVSPVVHLISPTGSRGTPSNGSVVGHSRFPGRGQDRYAGHAGNGSGR